MPTDQGRKYSSPAVRDDGLTRHDLYELVWSEPMLKLAARFDVSSSYLARVCARMNVPRPERGYWAKLAVNKAPEKPALPSARPGDELIWVRGGGARSVERPLPIPPGPRPRSRMRRTSTKRTGHPLVRGAKELFEAGRLSRDGGYLKPSKRLLLDLVVSPTGLDKALKLADRLYSALEHQGHQVLIAPNHESFQRASVDERDDPGSVRSFHNLWSPMRCTVVYVGTVAIGLTIIELAEEATALYVDGEYVRQRDYVASGHGGGRFRHSWSTKKQFPTGRLCLQAYSPYPGVKWVRQWRGAKGRSLSQQVTAIAEALEREACVIAALVEDAEKKANIERQRLDEQFERWRQEEAERKAKQALDDSRKDLLEIIDNWSQAARMEQFFRDAEQRLDQLPADDKTRLTERLRLARDLVGSVDPLDYFLAWKSPAER